MKQQRHIERNGYHVIDWPTRADLRIDDLWDRFPELVVGKYLVNTSFDSGFLTLSDSEQKEGWRMVGRLAHSPRIGSTGQIPHDHYDEWLIFDNPVEVESFETLVNYRDFSPVDFDWEENRLWDPIVSLSPLHVLGENEGVYLVSRDANLIDRILEIEW